MTNTLEELKKAAIAHGKAELAHAKLRSRYPNSSRSADKQWLVNAAAYSQRDADGALKRAARAYTKAVLDEPCALCGKPGCNTGCG